MKHILVPILILLGASPTLAQVDFLRDKEYKHCMQLTRIDPEQAFEKALSWQDLGGGLAARHCGAVALFSLEQYDQAATRLEELAKEMPDTTPSGIVADILGHAGIAWQQAGNLEKAYAVQTSALELSPQHPIFLTDRAMTLVEGGKIWEAIDDLNLALEVNADNVEILVFRGSAYRQVESYDLALEDLNRALSLDREHPEGLFERGSVYRETGKKDLARQDWLKVIELHEGRPVADLARRNLEKLDVKGVE